MARRIVLAVVLAIVASAALAVTTPAAEAETSLYGVGRDGNVAITMRDGTVLRANVYFPTDPDTGEAADGPFPVVLTSTPYGKDQGDTDPTRGDVGQGKMTYLVERGYIHVVVDVRGTGASEGQWSFNQPIEAEDGVQVVDWAAALPHSSGKVGLIGQSYAALNQLSLAAAVGPHSPLKAILPIVPSDDLYRDVLTVGGVPNPFLPIVYNAVNFPLAYINALGSLADSASTPQDVANLLAVLSDHVGSLGMLPVVDPVLGGPDMFDSSYWADRRPHSKLQDIVDNGVAALVLGAWKDAFQRGGPLLYAGLQNAAAGRSVDAPMTPNQPVSPKYQLIEGPWYHATIGLHPAEPYLDVNAIALQWFDHWLKGKDNAIGRTKQPLRSYDLTTQRWTQSATYPFPTTRFEKLWFGADRSLTPTRPATAGGDTIVWSNAPKCTPSLSQFMLIGNDVQAGVDNPCNTDDRPTQVGPDVATYTTEPLAQDSTLAGPIAARLFATATTTDTQWVVRVEDVAPDGTSLPLTRGGLLGSLRQLDDQRTWVAPDGTPTMPYHPYTQTSATPVVPGLVTRYDIDLFGTQATIEAGHRIRVTVSSGDAPAVLPTLEQTLRLAGGIYGIQRGGTAASYVQLPLTTGSLGTACADQLLCPTPETPR